MLVKKYYTLQKQLQMINDNKKTNISIENTSIQDFIKLKLALTKEKRIKQQLKKIDIAKRETILNCNIKLKYWFNNQNINCRKYYKLEQKELYKKDKTLYKLGYLNKKPTPPFVKSETFKSLINIKNSVQNKFKSVLKIPDSQISIANQLNTLAIKTVKIAIKGYRTILPSVNYIGNHINSLNITKYTKNVVSIAQRELDMSNSKPIVVSYSKRPFTEQEIAFRNSIRYVPNISTCVEKKIEHTKDVTEPSLEYTL